MTQQTDTHCTSVHWSLPLECELPRTHRENWHETTHPETGAKIRYRYTLRLTQQLTDGEWRDLDEAQHQPHCDPRTSGCCARVDPRVTRWEAAASAAGREVDRNALRAYMAVADEEQAGQRAYEQRLREQHDLDVAEINRLRDRVAELEAYAYGCDAEGCVIPHSSWCDAAKKTAAANDGCTCGKPWTGHPQPHAMHCWTVNPPRAEVEEMRKRIAELTAEVSAGSTAPAPTPAPLDASHSPAGDREGETGTEGAAGREGDSGPAVFETEISVRGWTA